ncbi:threonine-phosphate decarboxylase CobD [Niallia sp. Krafla_26]|uniref:threonine-phosphate decarboxylase CobD n=1 Tax=Niallia sp. Krafla_26 TaxID=3064703 RepID=UPI003D16840A
MIWPAHGSNPHYLYEAAGLKQPNRIIDFSANINPFGPPSSIKKKWGDLFGGIETYPDPQSTVLKKKLAYREEIDEKQILIGNGGAEIISLIGRWLSSKKVLIVEPAFSEYEAVCRINGCEISYFSLSEDWEVDLDSLSERLSNIDAVFFCNPNNPTGLYFNKRMIEDILKECRKKDCHLIVDEAFYDFVLEYESLVPLLNDYSNLLLLRSMTKIYGIPGLRLGYVMACRDLIETLTNYQSHWSVNSVAMKVGELCLEEEVYVQHTVQFIEKQRDILFSFYKKNGFHVTDSKVNFYLLKDKELEDQSPLFQFLLEKGIVPRHTFNFPGLEGRWLRFAIRTDYENKQLLEAMQEWRSIHPSY